MTPQYVEMSYGDGYVWVLLFFVFMLYWTLEFIHAEARQNYRHCILSSNVGIAGISALSFRQISREEAYILQIFVIFFSDFL